MPSIRFRDYICEGINKEEEDRITKTSPLFLQMELAQVLSDEP